MSSESVGFSVKSSPPKINNNSTVITSSAKALPVKTFVPSKKVVLPSKETFNTSVANKPVNAYAVKPNAFVSPGFEKAGLKPVKFASNID